MISRRSAVLALLTLPQVSVFRTGPGTFDYDNILVELATYRGGDAGALNSIVVKRGDKKRTITADEIWEALSK